MAIHKKRMRIVDAKEPWCEATLEDGTVIKVKCIFVSIYRHYDEKGNPIVNAVGVPHHDINTNSMIAVELVDGIEAATEKPKAQILRLIEGNDTEKENENGE